MLNKNLCHDGAKSPKKKVTLDTDDIIIKEDAAKRPKIISPKRQKYETQFEKYMVHKYVEEKI